MSEDAKPYNAEANKPRCEYCNDTGLVERGASLDWCSWCSGCPNTASPPVKIAVLGKMPEFPIERDKQYDWLRAYRTLVTMA